MEGEEVRGGGAPVLRLAQWAGVCQVNTTLPSVLQVSLDGLLLVHFPVECLCFLFFSYPSGNEIHNLSSLVFTLFSTLTLSPVKLLKLNIDFLGKKN